MIAAKSPGAVSFDEDEIYRINRAQAALLLHIEPERVDKMPGQDVRDVLEINQANEEIRAWYASRRRRK